MENTNTQIKNTDTTLHHDDVARDMEQAIDGVTYVEAEGSDCTRVDFGSQSVWFWSRTGGVFIEGRLSKGNLKKIKRYLQAAKLADAVNLALST